MTRQEFEELLGEMSSQLTEEVRENAAYRVPQTFENRVRTVLQSLAKDRRVKVDFAPHPHIFPDIVVGQFGIEVKVTNKDSWRSVANSVFEGTRDVNVRHIYILFGKMGGEPEVRWGRYEDCVMHVRTSHVPRFEVEIDPKESLFAKLGVSYEEFYKLPAEDKMRHIRKYARGRLSPGERLWWLEDTENQEHSLSLQVRLYMRLPQDEKRKLDRKS